MGKEQFAQKIEPKLNQKLQQLIEQYADEGRIKEKGEILNLLYQDHVTVEEKRQARKQADFTEELDSHLSRIEELFFQTLRSLQYKNEIQERRHQEQLKQWGQQKEELNQVIQIQKEHLKEKTIEGYELSKYIEKLERKIKGIENKTNLKH